LDKKSIFVSIIIVLLIENIRIMLLIIPVHYFHSYSFKSFSIPLICFLLIFAFIVLAYKIHLINSFKELGFILPSRTGAFKSIMCFFLPVIFSVVQHSSGSGLALLLFQPKSDL